MKRGPARVVLLLLLSTVVGFISAFCVNDEHEWLTLAAGVAALALVLVPVAMEDRLDWFHPLMYFGASLFLGTTFRSYFIIFGKSAGAAFLMHGRTPDVLLPGAGLVLLGSAGIFLGYLLNRMRTSPRSQPAEIENEVHGDDSVTWNQRRINALIIVAIIISVCATLYIMASTVGGLQSISIENISQKRRIQIDSATNASGAYAVMTYFTWLSEWENYVFFASLIQVTGVKNRRVRDVVLCLIAGFVAFIPSFVSSARTDMIVIAIGIVLILSWNVRLRASYVFGAAIVMLVVFVGMMILRRQAQNESTSFSSVGEVFDIAYSTHNYVDVVKHAFLIDATPTDLPYFYGKSYFAWLYAPIPRSFWPDKPLLTDEIAVTRELFGGREHPTGIEFGGTPLGLFGESFRNFGFAGVFVVSFIYGALVWKFYRYFNCGRPVSNNGKLVYVATFMWVGFGSADIEFVRVITEIGMAVIPCAFIIWVASERRTSNDSAEKRRWNSRGGVGTPN